MPGADWTLAASCVGRSGAAPAYWTSESRTKATVLGAPITVENMRGQLLGDGLVMLKYTSENHGRRSNRTSLWRRVAPGRWQIFHHQGTITSR